jgi:glycosyltransferase involved in cell wall biosynthesis
MGSAVTIGIPTHGSSRFLPETIESVMDQTYDDYTAIIVACGCPDDAVARIEEKVCDDRRFRVLRQANLGASVARNRVASEADSEFLAFLDHDDLWDPRFLEALIAGLHNSVVPAAHCVAQGISADGAQVGTFGEWSRRRQRAERHRLVTAPPGSTSFESLATAPCIASPGAGVVRRSSFEEIGRFQPSLWPCDDWDLWIRLSRLEALAFIDEPLFYYRRHDTNSHVHDWKTMGNTRRVRRRTISDPRNSRQQQRYARHAARVFYRGQGLESLRDSSWKRRALGLVRIGYSLTF